MLSMIREIDTKRYTRRTYIVSSGDEFSEGKAREFESGLGGRGMIYDESRGGDGGGEREGDGSAVGEVGGMGRGGDGDVKDGNEGENGAYRILHVPRARRIHQSLFTTPLSVTPSSHLLPHNEHPANPPRHFSACPSSTTPPRRPSAAGACRAACGYISCARCR